MYNKHIRGKCKNKACKFCKNGCPVCNDLHHSACKTPGCKALTPRICGAVPVDEHNDAEAAEGEGD